MPLSLPSRCLRALGLCALLHAGFAWALLDTDGNGASDVWEEAYGPLVDPDGDDDGDGFSNLDEARAGTDPNDPEDYPRVLRLDTPGGSTVRKRWNSVPGIRYRILASPDFLNWFPVGPAVIGDGGEMDGLLSLQDAMATGGVPCSRWTGLAGGGINRVKSHAAAGTPLPDEERQITRLEIPATVPDENQFGHWIRGWLLPPESGDYVFWLASDDAGELWVSTSADPAGLELAASVIGHTGFREWGKYPSQESAPRQLSAGTYYYFEVFHRENQGGDHLSVAWTRPGMAAGTREIIDGNALSSLGLSLSAIMDGKGLLFFRLEAEQVDSDGDGVSDYEEILLGLNPARANSKPRRPDLGEALALLGRPHSISLGVTLPRAYEAGGHPAQFVFFREGGLAPVTVQYAVSGTATPGADYVPLSGSVHFPAGARSTLVTIHPVDDGVLESQESVVLTLLAGPGYQVGSPNTAWVTIDDATDVLYVAALRPPGDVASGASGIARLRRAGNSLGSLFSLSFSGLLGEQLGAELLVSDDGLAGTAALALPLHQIPGLAWDFGDVPDLTREQILVALDGQRLWLRIRSAAFPGGELIGRLQTGWDTMPPPPPPPPAPAQSAEAGEIALFFAQATFGARAGDLDAPLDFEAWIDAQLAMPPTFHLPYVQARRAELIARDGSDGWQTPRQEAFWQAVMDAPDQLRQRMAFALSQILVISQFGALDTHHEGTARYYDMLVEHAFGNYRDLLENVTLSPMMGTYLSMQRNKKPDELTGHEPDENYAREVMQLFTIGLNRLHPDGSVMLDAEGRPFPTYTQDDTVGLAHVFTGWGPHYDPRDPPRWSNGSVADRNGWFQWGYDAMRPMSFYGTFHDNEERILVGGVRIPAGTNGVERLGLALDALFQHPNVGPFLARQLIQRFVTSNPSPGYVYRVASVFDDNGQGVRGDLGATIKAVLLDYEARHPDARGGIAFGKPAEPVLRVSRFLRGLDIQPPLAGDSRYFLSFQYSIPEQAPLLSPSVFNFFQPGYSNPGEIARAGLLSPEFQIFAETTAIRQANRLYGMLTWAIWTSEPDGQGGNALLRPDFTPWIALLDTPGLTPVEAQNLLLDRLGELLLFGGLTPELRADILGAYAALPSWFNFTTDRQRWRVRVALYLLLNSPEAFVQR